MARLTRWFLILLALAFSARLAFAADVRESSAFDTAVQTFKISRELSVQDFADFIRKYPTSVRRPEAILYEAQGMLYGGDATNAIQLLSTNHSDKLAPKYLYWLGQAYFQNRDYPNATNIFGQMIEKFPGAPDALDATIRQANAFVHLEPAQWSLVVKLLSDTNKPFQEALRSGSPLPQPSQAGSQLNSAPLSAVTVQPPRGWTDAETTMPRSDRSGKRVAANGSGSG